MGAVDIDKLFDGMAKAEIFGKGNFMEEGLYEIVTKSIFVKDGFKGKSFICEFEIVKSNNAAHPVGSSGSYVLKFDSKYIMGNVSELVLALLGYENTRENQQNAEIRKQVELVTRAACGSESAKKELGEDFEEGMLHGIRLGLETKKRPTQPTLKQPQGGEYTAHKWSPIADAPPAQTAA